MIRPYLEQHEMQSFEKMLNEHILRDTMSCWRFTRIEGSSASLASEGNISKSLLKAFDEVKKLSSESYDKPKPSPYEMGQIRVALLPEPEGQKFSIGEDVLIARDDEFSSKTGYISKKAKVICTYAHAYGGNDIKSYLLDVEGRGTVAWFEESQLEAL